MLCSFEVFEMDLHAPVWQAFDEKISQTFYSILQANA
jgi:hypothetical protein